jgi:hypothetical protein
MAFEVLDEIVAQIFALSRELVSHELIGLVSLLLNCKFFLLIERSMVIKMAKHLSDDTRLKRDKTQQKAGKT